MRWTVPRIEDVPRQMTAWRRYGNEKAAIKTRDGVI